MKNTITNLILLFFFSVIPYFAEAGVSYGSCNSEKKEIKFSETEENITNEKAKLQKIKKGKKAQKNKPFFELLPNGWLPAGLILMLIGAVMALFGGFIAILGAVLAAIGLGFVIYWIVREVRRPY